MCLIWSNSTKLNLINTPKDAYFTPVCTTEMIAFANAYTYFEQKNTSLIGLSIDSNPSHLAWIYDIYLRTGIKIQFPIIADRNGIIARKYGMIANDVSTTETVRNVYIIDPNGIIRLILIYPLNVGRCIPEILRTLDALQISDQCNVSTPANWSLGKSLINPAPKTFKELQARADLVQNNNNDMSWYLSFKKPEDCKENYLKNNNVKKIENKTM